MRWRLFIIYMFSMILLWCNRPTTTFSQITTPSFIQQITHQLDQVFNSKKHSRLLIAFVTGYKQKLPKKTKRIYKDLCIYHLFTPSGIHLAAIYGLLFPLFLFLRKKNRIGAIILQIIACLSLYFLPGFYSLKRISSFRIFQLITGNKLPLFGSFFIVFLGDFLVGTYSHNPLSFCYSFLFLGVIIATAGQFKLLLPIALMGAQLIIGFFQETPISLTAPIIGFILTALFSPFFIVYFLTFWISFLLPMEIFKYPIIAFDRCVLLFHSINALSPSIIPGAPVLIIIALFLIPIPVMTRRLLFILLILIQATPVHNLPKKITGADHYEWNWIDKSQIISVKRYYRGYRIDYASGYRCYYQHANWFYNESCY